MTDIELLPLPNSGSGFYEDNVWHDAFSKRQMEAYASAYAAHATAAQAAEIEALRAVRDSFQRVGIAAQARAERLAEVLRLIESAKDRGFGIDYARGVAQSALRDHDQEVGNG